MKLLDKLRGKAWIKWVGYALFYNLVFYGALYITFPYDTLRDRIVSEARNRMGLDLRIGKIRLAGISGVKLSDVTLVTGDPAQPPSAAELARLAEEAEGEGEEGADLAALAGGEPDGIRIDSLTTSVALLPTLQGKQALTFAVDAWGGTMKVKVTQDEAHRALQVQARGVDLDRSPLQHYSGLDLAGSLSSLEIDLQAEGADFTKAQGFVALKGENLLLRGGEVQNFELPAVALGTLDGRLDIEEGEGKTDTFEINGDDLAAKLELTVRLASQIKASTLAGKLELKPSDEWWDRNEMLKAAANFALPDQGDGWRALKISGQLQKPGFRP